MLLLLLLLSLLLLCAGHWGDADMDVDKEGGDDFVRKVEKEREKEHSYGEGGEDEDEDDFGPGGQDGGTPKPQPDRFTSDSDSDNESDSDDEDSAAQAVVAGVSGMIMRACVLCKLGLAHEICALLLVSCKPQTHIGAQCVHHIAVYVSQYLGALSHVGLQAGAST
jgi:hypothetical protein